MELFEYEKNIENVEYYERAGESLVPLKQYKIDAIRSQERKDWSKQVILML